MLSNRGLSTLREMFARRKKKYGANREITQEKYLRGSRLWDCQEAQYVVEVVCTAFEGKFDIISLGMSSYWLLSRILARKRHKPFSFFFKFPPDLTFIYMCI